MSTTARADNQELYTVVGYQAGASHYLLPASGSGSVTTYAGGADVTAYYGLNNKVHVGARVRASMSSDVRITDAKVTVPGGSQSTGDVYADQRSLGIGALALYRLDTGYALGPVFEVEAGFTARQYRRISHVPTGRAFFVELPNKSETVLYGSAAGLVEYRFRNWWVVSAGVALQVEPGGLRPWSVAVPLRFGRIW